MPCTRYPRGLSALLSEPDQESRDLDSMTKAELLAYAKEKNISGVSSAMLKADILSRIKEAI